MFRLPKVFALGLLCASPALCAAQGAQMGEPAPLAVGERMALVSAARLAMAGGLQANERLSLRKVWTDGQTAQVCAVRTDAQGQPMVKQGDQLLNRALLQKTGHTWRVAHTERLAVSQSVSMDLACGPQAGADQVVAAAIDAMATHPPGAGQQTPLNQPGVVAASGRSLLHTQPDSAYRMGQHLVRGDKVVTEARSRGWSRVRYTHPITGVVTVGWLSSQRLADAVQTSTSTSSP